MACMHGDLRPWFTGRKSLYGPSTRSYYTFSSAGRKLKFGMPVYDLAVYGPYTSLRPVFALYDHWQKAEAFAWQFTTASLRTVLHFTVRILQYTTTGQFCQLSIFLISRLFILIIHIPFHTFPMKHYTLALLAHIISSFTCVPTGNFPRCNSS